MIMKHDSKYLSEGMHKNEDLNGLLAAYKKYNTYFRILIGPDKKDAILELADNPGAWLCSEDKERYEGFRELKRIELSIDRLFVNFIAPEHIVFEKGQTLGMQFPYKQLEVINNLGQVQGGYFSLKVPFRYVPDLINFVRDLVRMPPQIKYEIIEKYIVDSM